MPSTSSAVAIAALAAMAQGYKCPGSGSTIHASCELSAVADASCDVVANEMAARANAKAAGTAWTDPHNGGIYSVTGGDASELQTQRTSNPAKAVGGKLYTDKQIFTFTSQSDNKCLIEACSESQGFSIGDFSTNYCDMRNLFCGKADGCTPVISDFTSTEKEVKPSIGATHDFTKCIVKADVEPRQKAAVFAKAQGYKCPGSGSAVHASCELSAVADASCDVVAKEMAARANAKAAGTAWTDPHNGGIYSVTGGDANELWTQRTSNPAKAVGGKLYTDKQVFTFTSQSDNKCLIEACSESQGFSIGDFSTNYCDMRNLFCGKADGCTPVVSDFTSTEKHVKPSIGASHDFSKCIVKADVEPSQEAAVVAKAQGYKCPGSGTAIHASCELSAVADASCDVVSKEMAARANAKAAGTAWTDPHNGGIYSIIGSTSTDQLETMRTSNPAKAVGGKLYTDKQVFTFTSQSDNKCLIEACSESQGFSIGDFSTNYCDMRNLFCGKADGCTPIISDFTSTEKEVKPSIGATHDFTKCIVKADAEPAHDLIV